MNTSKELIDKLHDMFFESVKNMRRIKDEARIHYKYFHGDQLPKEVLDILKERGQPEYWKNIYKMNLNKVIGYYINGKKDVIVVGRQQNDINLANVMNDILKYIQERNDYQEQKKKALVDLALAGYTVFEAYPYKTTEDDYEIAVNHIEHDEVFLDVYSKRTDYADAKYIHRAIWVDKEDLYNEYPKEKVDQLRANNWSSDEYVDELADEGLFEGSERERVLLIQSWWKENGKVYYATWSDYTILEYGEDPYNLGSFPFVVVKLNQYGSKDIYGWFRDIKPIQDAYNFTMLKVQNMINGVKILIEEDATKNVDAFEMQYRVDGGVIVVNAGSLMSGKIREINNARDIAQLFQFMEAYKRDAQEVLGINDELLGFDTRVLSGEAIEKRQQVGVLSLVNFIDELTKLDKKLFEIVVHLVDLYYTDYRVFSIADENSLEGFKQVVINEPVYDENGNPVLEITEEGVKPVIRNHIQVGKFDLIVDQRPPMLTQRRQRFQEGMQYLGQVAQIAPDVARKFLAMVIKDSDYQAKDELIQLLNASFEEVLLAELQKNPQLMQKVLMMFNQMQQMQGGNMQ